MDSLIAIAAAILYVLAIATIIPGLSQQSGIKAKTVFASAACALVFHAWILSDLIFDGSGQNLSILNVASLISFYHFSGHEPCYVEKPTVVFIASRL